MMLKRNLFFLELKGIQDCLSQILILTLTGNYDKYSICTEKIMIDIFSVYPEISFDNNKSEQITATS